jgi:hypothetical protein
VKIRDVWKRVKPWIKVTYCFLLLGILLYASHHFSDVNLAFWNKSLGLRGLDLAYYVGLAVVLAAVIYSINELLHSRGSKVFEWRPFRNLNFVPVDYKLLRVPFFLLLYFNLPILAWIEEYIFRDGFSFYPTQNWFDAVLRSIVFGFAHIIGGVRLRVAFPLTLAGLWFSFQYLNYGLDGAVLSHFVYNFIALSFMLCYWIITKKNPFED